MLLNFSTLGFSARMATTADLAVRCVPLAPRLAPATAAPPSTAAAKPAAPTEAAPVAPVVAMVPTCPWLRSWPCCATGATKALALAVKAAGINSDLAISAKKLGVFGVKLGPQGAGKDEKVGKLRFSWHFPSTIKQRMDKFLGYLDIYLANDNSWNKKVFQFASIFSNDRFQAIDSVANPAAVSVQKKASSGCALRNCWFIAGFGPHFTNQKSQFCGRQILPLPESNLFRTAKPATCATCKIQHSPRFIPCKKTVFVRGSFRHKYPPWTSSINFWHRFLTILAARLSFPTRGITSRKIMGCVSARDGIDLSIGQVLAFVFGKKHPFFPISMGGKSGGFATWDMSSD